MNDSSPDPFENALAELLAPLTRAMVARGITLGAAVDSLKQALLDTALETEGPSVSDSRISVMTGLHRKDVRRLRSVDPATSGRKTTNQMALLIGYWATAPDFQGPDGQPRPLRRESDGNEPGFNELVRRVRLDVAPGTILQALSDQGAIEEDTDGRFHHVANALIPTIGSKELVAAYRATLSPHLEAATHNLLAEANVPRHFDRVVRFSHLSQASIRELEDVAKADAQAVLEKLNKKALDLQARDTSTNAKGKFAAGAYVLPTPDATESEAE